MKQFTIAVTGDRIEAVKSIAEQFQRLGSDVFICDASFPVSTDEEPCSESRNCIPFERALQRDEIDAVAIAATPERSAGIAIQALFSGKNVLILGLPSQDVKKIDELYEIAEKTKLNLTIGFGLESHPAILMLKDLIANDELGPVQYIYFDRWRPDSDSPDILAEAVAVIITLFGELPSQVSMMPPPPGPGMQTITLLEFSGKRRAHVFSGQPVEDRLVVCGDRKAAVLTFDGDAPAMAIHNQPATFGEKVPLLTNADSIPISIPSGDSVQGLSEAFLSSCQSREITEIQNPLRVGVLKVMAALRTSSIQKGLPTTVAA